MSRPVREGTNFVMSYVSTCFVQPRRTLKRHIHVLQEVAPALKHANARIAACETPSAPAVVLAFVFVNRFGKLSLAAGSCSFEEICPGVFSDFHGAVSGNSVAHEFSVGSNICDDQ